MLERKESLAPGGPVVSSSILAMIAEIVAHSTGTTDADRLRQYDQAVQAVMQARPELTRSAAIRLLNGLLEIHDPRA